MTLDEIEAKIAALKSRYADLDNKLIKPGMGMAGYDIAVERAMRKVKDEISRLAGLRENALVADLIVEKVAAVDARPRQSPDHRSDPAPNRNAIRPR